MKFPNFQNFTNLLTAFFLTIALPDHLVADAYHAAGRAMDFNHDVSQLRAKDRQVEEAEEEPLKDIQHDHEDGRITLVCSEKEYEVYNEAYQSWKAKDAQYQEEINDSGGLRKTYIETKRSLYRLAKRPNTPPRKLGTWSEGTVKEGLQKGMGRVSRISSQLSQSHAQDLQNLKSDPLNATHLLKAPATITNEILGQGLHLMGEVFNPVFDKAGSVARQILRAQGVSPQVASDVVYGLEGATLLYGGVKGVSSLTKASRLGKVNSVKAVAQVPPVRTIEALGLEVPKVKTQLLERPIDSKYYSVAYKAKIEHGVHYPGKPDRVHFQECNRQLYTAFKNDAEFALQFEKSYPGINEFVQPGAKGAFKGRSPTELGLTWHHNAYEVGELELIPFLHHKARGAVQKNLHPNGKGGSELWAGGKF